MGCAGSSVQQDDQEDRASSKKTGEDKEDQVEKWVNYSEDAFEDEESPPLSIAPDKEFEKRFRDMREMCINPPGLDLEIADASLEVDSDNRKNLDVDTNGKNLEEAPSPKLIPLYLDREDYEAEIQTSGNHW